MQEETNYLVGDIGGTNARFGLVSVQSVKPSTPFSLECKKYSGLGEAIEFYLDSLPPGTPRPRRGCIAIAAPINYDQVRMTNLDWSFSVTKLTRQLGFADLWVLNDFAALAHVLPYIPAGESKKIGGGQAQAQLQAQPKGTLAVLGPGTGLGVGALIQADGQWQHVATEGGNIGFAPATRLEMEILKIIGETNKPVSVEQLLSGAGLVTMYKTLAKIEDRKLDNTLQPAEITTRGLAAEDELCQRTLQLFCAILGGFAGDVALMFTATGGIYLGGGILPRMADFLAHSEFRNRFEDKGRYKTYVAKIETKLILSAYPALTGAAVYLQRQIKTQS